VFGTFPGQQQQSAAVGLRISTADCHWLIGWASQATQFGYTRYSVNYQLNLAQVIFLNVFQLSGFSRSSDTIGADGRKRD
jgi:hypothetical protein